MQQDECWTFKSHVFKTFDLPDAEQAELRMLALTGDKLDLLMHLFLHLVSV